MGETAFSQRDPRWSSIALGTGKLTIGQAGCLLCSVASMVADFGWATNPQRLNAWLKKHEGFVDENLFVFAAIDGGWCRFTELIRCDRHAAPVQQIRWAIDSGAGVLIKVDFQPGGVVQQHWVRLLRMDEHTGLVMDPWQLPGAERIPLELYLARGWTAERGIFGVAVYERLPGRREIAWLGLMDAYQDELSLRRDGVGR